jgi:PAS domain-containing protein
VLTVGEGREPETSAEVSALAQLVVRQRDELARMRVASRTRAVVEQAKGVIAERLSCTPDQAYEHLLRVSKTRGIGVVEVCAGVLGVAVPPPDPDTRVLATAERAVFDSTRYVRPLEAPAARAGDIPTEPARTDASSYHVALAAFDSAQDADELARLLREEVGSDALSAVMVYVVEPDGGLRLEGADGISTQLRLEWQRMPMHVPTAAVACLRSGMPLWLPDSRSARARYVLIGDEESWPSRAWTPFTDGSRIIGLVGLMWDGTQVFEPTHQRYLQTVAQAAGQRLLAMLSSGPPVRSRNWKLWIQHVLDGLPGAVAMLSAARDSSGAVVDFQVDAASPEAIDVAGRRYQDLIGTTVLSSYPTIVDTELWPAYHRVLQTGVSEFVGPFDYTEVAPGTPRFSLYSVAVSKFGDGLLVAWNQHDSPQQAELLGRVQRLGNLGWGRWNLVTDEVTWSDQLYVMFGRDPARGPMRLEEIPEVVVEEDLPVLASTISRIVELGQPVDTEFRLLVHGQARHVRLIAEPTSDVSGKPVVLDGIVQDITTTRRTQQQLVQLNEQIQQHRDQFTQEHRVATHLRRAVLPLPAEPLSLPGMRVAVRYLAAERWADVGGDWYHALALADGSVLLAVGDVAGHGLTTAATMAQLRYALTGAALMASDPPAVLGVLNTLLTGSGTVTLASAVVARFQPRNRRLSWAQAGHPAPLLIRGDGVLTLDRPRGPVLGAVPGASYDTAEETLQADDTLLLFTDGLIERRPGPHARGDDLEVLIKHVRGVIRSVEITDMPSALTAQLVPATSLDDTCIVAATIVDDVR